MVSFRRALRFSGLEPNHGQKNDAEISPGENLSWRPSLFNCSQRHKEVDFKPEAEESGMFLNICSRFGGEF